MLLDRIRLVLDKSLQIDGAERDAFVAKVKLVAKVVQYNSDTANKPYGASVIKYSGEEEKEIENALARLESFDGLSIKSKIMTASPLVSSVIGRTDSKAIAYGRSEIVVHASAEEVMAFMWHFSARVRMKENDLEKTVVEAKNLHHIIGYVCKKGTHNKGILNLLPREGLSSNVWKIMEDKSLVMAATPTTHKDRGITEERVRVKLPFTVKLEPQSEDRCKLI